MEPRIAICFFGITRSLSHTLQSITQNALEPARAAGNTHVYAHFFRQRSLAHARTGETGELDPDEHRLLHPDWLEMEEPGLCLETWDFEGLKPFGDFWKNDFQSMHNLMHQLHSLNRVTEAALADGAEVCLFLRPDLRYHDSLAPAIRRAMRAARAGRPLVQLPDWQAWEGGRNDRFAIVAGPAAIAAYGQRVRQMADFCAAKQAPLHSEQLLRFALDQARIPVRTIRARASRVRLGGAVHDEDFLPDWVVRLQAASDRQMHRVNRVFRVYSLPQIGRLLWQKVRRRLSLKGRPR